MARVALIMLMLMLYLSMLHPPTAQAQTGEPMSAVTPADTPPVRELPAKLQCQADQTAGLHDYAGAPQEYEPSTFFESKFQLRVNRVLMRHLSADTTPGSGSPTERSPDLFLTLLPRNDRPVELRCRQVQGNNQELGYSCTNTPPSEILLISPVTLRFTRASIGGWTFSSPTATGPAIAGNSTDVADADQAGTGDESLFVEYGTCEKR